jgi:hypothetical protein
MCNEKEMTKEVAGQSKQCQKCSWFSHAAAYFCQWCGQKFIDKEMEDEVDQYITDAIQGVEKSL